LQLGFSDAPPEVAKSKDEFLIQREKPTETELTEAFSVMRPIELAELRDAFMRAKPVVLKLIKANLSK
jgi:hypothetical protein